MEKLYKKVRGKLHYHEAWEEDHGYTEHWGVVGERGESREVKAPKGVRSEAAMRKALDLPRKAGYAPIDLDNHATLVIEYKTGKIPKKDLAKRHALEDWLNDKLGWTGLGHCDGGSIGSGTMEAFSFVVDYALAKRVIAGEIKGTEFEDFARIFKVAPEKPAPKARGKGLTYAKGDCLVVALPKGRFTAAYVAAEESGACVIVDLDVLSEKAPALADFHRMKPLALRHDSWDGELSIIVSNRTKDMDKQVTVAGNLPIQWPDIAVRTHQGIWANFKGPRDVDLDEAMKSVGEFDPKSPARYLSYGEWAPGMHAGMQEAWNAKRKPAKK